MRPKIVILTLIVAFGILGAVALLKGVAGKNGANGDNAPGTTAANTPADTQATETNNQSATASAAGNTAVSEQLRAAVISKAIDEIQEIVSQADGTNNPAVISALVARMSNPELEVRKAALQALKELNDTNAVTPLQQVADATKDPHEKVAVLDVIDYLNLPSATPAAPPDGLEYTNFISIPHTNLVNRNRAAKGRTRDAGNGAAQPVQTQMPDQSPTPIQSQTPDQSPTPVQPQTPDTGTQPQ